MKTRIAAFALLASAMAVSAIGKTFDNQVPRYAGKVSQGDVMIMELTGGVHQRGVNASRLLMSFDDGHIPWPSPDPPPVCINCDWLTCLIWFC